MAVERKDIEIFFKIEGLEGYITDLETLDSVLQQVNTATTKTKDSTNDLESAANNIENSLDKSKQSVQGFKGAVDILGGSVETLVGGLGLLGAEPQWLKNVEDGATKAIAFADGISRLADGINDVREYINTYTAATKANTIAIQAQDTATKAATVSTRTLSTVLKGVGIGLVIAGIAALIANYDKLLGKLGLGKKAFDDSAKLQIANLETEQRIAEIRGQTDVQSKRREEEIARLRAKLAQDYLGYLQQTGATAEEVNAAYEEAIAVTKDWEVSQVATAEAVRKANLQFKEDADGAIATLEQEQALADINGQTVVEQAQRETEIAKLRAQDALNYVKLLEDQGGTQEEINAAVDEATKLIDAYEVATAKQTKTEGDYNKEQNETIRLIDEKNKAIVGSIGNLEAVAEELDKAVDYEQESLKVRLGLNEDAAYIRTLVVQKQLDEERKALDDQLANKLISEELYRARLGEIEREAYEKVQNINADREEKEKAIIAFSIKRRYDLAAAGVQALMALNEATAGATEEEQRAAFERNKKLQIGLATIQTAQAVTAALTAGGNPIKLATGAQFIEAGIAATVGLAQILAIRRTEFDSPDTNIEVPTPALPSGVNNPGTTMLPGQTTGETPSSIQGGPIRAYVLVSDVNSAQQANSQIENLVKL